jgi:VIT1/CCC1 family predicted Fe2+/Mn2+ transporter
MALSSGYFLATLAWIVWGVATPGDYFANGAVLSVGISVAFAGISGIVLGWRAKGHVARTAILALAIFSTAFWCLVRDGWWAKSPHRPTESVR